MGARGPKPGFKKARAAQAAAPSSSPEASNTEKPKARATAKPANVPEQQKAPEPQVQAAEQPKALSAADRENPDKLSGDDLRALAHRRGLAKSVLATMPDEKIRMELRYITNRQYNDELA
jgi:hypothetical protein